MNFLEIFRNYNIRLRVVAYLLFIMLLVLSVGLGYRQLFKYSEYSEKGARQTLRRIIIPGPRGNIYDRDGRLWVGNRPRYSATVFLTNYGLNSEKNLRLSENTTIHFPKTRFRGAETSTLRREEMSSAGISIK